MKLLKIPFDAGNPTGSAATASAPEEIAKFFPEIEQIDVAVNQSNFEETMKNIEAAALQELKTSKICSIGGDHSITYALVKAASQIHKNLTLIYFDAHLDCEDDFLPPSHEDVIKAIVNQKLVKPENIIIVGARKSWPKEQAFVKENNIRVIKPEEIDKLSANSCQLTAGPVYISVDIDVFDPELAPATGYPEKQGINLQQFQKFTERLDFNRIIGFDLVEVAPSLENGKKTVTLASDVIKFLLC